MKFGKIRAASAMGVVIAAGAIGAAGLMGGAGVREAAPGAAVNAFTVDAVHSSVVFRVKHMNAAYFYGAFKEVEGSFLLDPANPSASSISVTVAADSIDTRNEGRDKHLKSQDFFSAAEHPKITFTGKSFEKTGEENGETAFKVTGDLTMLGKTREIVATVRHTGQGQGRGGKEVGGMETKVTIKRSDFGMDYMVGKGLGDEVTFIASLEGGR